MRKDRFTDEALAQAKALAELKMNDAESFAEAYDYARCQRPDGSFYGIPSGKQCRKGSKAAPANSGSKKSAAQRMAAAYDKGGFAPKKNKKSDAAVKPVEPKKSQGTRPKAAIEADMKKLTSSGAMQQVEGKTTPKKPTDYERGGTLKGALGPIAKAEKDKKIYEDQIKKANEYLKKDPEDEFAGFMKEQAEKSLKPITNSEKVVEGVTKDVPKGTKVEFKSNGFLGTTFTTPGGTVVTTSFGQGDFNFQVNGKYDAGQITDRKEQMAIARQVQRVWNAHRQNLPEGYVVQATAWGEDGRGASRIRAYKRMGFSDPTSGTDANPGTQYGRIGKGGKVSASDRAEQGLGSTLLMFAEGKDKDTALWYIAIFGAPDKKNDFNEGNSLEFARCQRPDGSRYGIADGKQCRKGREVSLEDLGVKPPKGGVGPMSSSALAEVKKAAKSEAYSWGDTHDKLFDKVYAKAETTAHLGKIHKAVMKAVDEGDIDAKEGTLKIIKKAMGDHLKVEMRSGQGAKREAELANMTPEQRRRARTEEAIKRGIKNKVVRAR